MRAQITGNTGNTAEVSADGSLNMRLAGSNVTTEGSVRVTMTSSLSESNAGDNVGIAKMYKGGVTTALNNISVTTTSSEVDCKGFNSIIVHISGITGTWDISVQNATISGGAFVDGYDDRAVQMKATGVTAARSIVFRGVLDYVKIVGTNIAAGAVTVKVVPINL